MDNVYFHENGEEFFQKIGYCLVVSLVAQLLTTAHCVKGQEYLLTAPFNCTITGCSMKGKLFLHQDMKLIVKHNPNEITHLKNQPGSFKSRNIAGSYRESLRQSLINCPFPSREFHKKTW